MVGMGRVWSRQGDVTDKKEWLIVLECNVFLFGILEPVMKCVGKSLQNEEKCVGSS